MILFYVLFSILVVGIIVVLVVILAGKGSSARKNVIVGPQSKDASFYLHCGSVPVDCNEDGDCEVRCLEATVGEKIKCLEVNKTGGARGRKICVSEKTQAEIKCNAETGTLALTAKNYPERMEFSCECMYPFLYGGEDCGTLQSNICRNGTFSRENGCVCGDGYIKVTPFGSEVGKNKLSGPMSVAICIKPEDAKFYNGVINPRVSFQG